MHVVLFNRVDNGREDLLDIMRAVEVHEMQGQSFEFVGKVLELVEMLIEP